MNLLSLSWKNLMNKPLSMALSLILFGLGVGLVSLLLLLEKQLDDNFKANLAEIDLVIGAKGSPLQLILSSMYHIDTPTGNISLEEATLFLNPKHPLIEQSIPLSMGDSHQGHRIVGTTTDILDWYNASIAQGKKWEADFEVNIGASVAKKLGLGLGATFNSSHGYVVDDNLIHDHGTPFKVVGILKPTGTVIDQLILTTTQSYWFVHGDHDHDHGGHDHEGHDHEGHDHEGHDHEGHDHEGHDHEGHDHEGHDHEGHDHEGHDHEGHDHEGHDHEGHDHEGHDHEGHDHEGHDHEGHDHEGHDHEGHNHEATTTPALSPFALAQQYPDKEITALLVRFKGLNYQALNFGQNINDNTDMQAATPAIEVNRLFSMMDTGQQALRILALVIMIVSGLSIFISLYASLRSRKYELALMRVMGSGPTGLFSLIIFEGLILAGLGYLLGFGLSRLGMAVLAQSLEDGYRYSFSAFEFLPQEGIVLGIAILIGLVSALIPAIQASKTEIGETLIE